MAPPNFSSPLPANTFATILDWEEHLDGLPPAPDDFPVILDQLPEAKAARAAAGVHEDDYMEQLWAFGMSALAAIPTFTTIHVMASWTKYHGLVTW